MSSEWFEVRLTTNDDGLSPVMFSAASKEVTERYIAEKIQHDGWNKDDVRVYKTKLMDICIYAKTVVNHVVRLAE